MKLTVTVTSLDRMPASVLARRCHSRSVCVAPTTEAVLQVLDRQVRGADHDHRADDDERDADAARPQPVSDLPGASDAVLDAELSSSSDIVTSAAAPNARSISVRMRRLALPCSAARLSALPTSRAASLRWITPWRRRATSAAATNARTMSMIVVFERRHYRAAEF